MVGKALFGALALCACGAASAARLATLGKILGYEAEQSMWEKFKAEHGKAYSTVEEHDMRFGVFKQNLRRMAEVQKNDPTAEHGVTVFADLTPEEFQAQYLGLAGDISAEQRAKRAAPELSTDDLPDEFDWREKGAVTPVKNQGACGSCWAFSTTGAVEGAVFVKTGKLTSLSEQQLVDCDHECDPHEPRACDSGCNGGLPSNAMEYIEKNGGLDTEKSYPYVGINERECKADKGSVSAHVGNFTILKAGDEAQMKAALVANGPLSIGINAIHMQFYLGGVSCPYVCPKHSLDHGVLITGYGKAGAARARLAKVDYWTIKNSWGPGWGEKGFIRVCSGKNMCGLGNMVTSVTAAS